LWFLVLRPSDSFLGSSRATHRANLRAERLKTFGQIFRFGRGTVTRLWNAAVELTLLCGLPFAYLVASYLALDLPARWLSHRGAYGRWGLLLFAASVVIAAVGFRRALRDAPPIAPVRPRFAKAMLGLSWIAAVLCTIGDLAS
jgi:hypothetical protein